MFPDLLLLVNMSTLDMANASESEIIHSEDIGGCWGHRLGFEAACIWEAMETSVADKTPFSSQQIK